MATIVFLDKEDFSHQDINEKPIAGAQTAFIELVKALAKLGHCVCVRNSTIREYKNELIDWQNINAGEVPIGDFYIVNRSTSLLPLVPKGKRIFFWLHNEGKYLLRPSNLKLLMRHYPILVFSGKYHRSSFLLWFLFRWRIIPYGISNNFLINNTQSTAPSPKVIFTSNPLRSLDWLVDRWKVIHTQVPAAELHIFSGSSTYGAWGNSVRHRMQKVLDYVEDNREYGIFLRDPIKKDDLINELKSCRAMLYRGDKAETFCLAVAEVQVMGIPCVVQDLGSMKERVIDGITGFVTKSDQEFEEKSISVLTDDALWLQLNSSLHKNKYYFTWSEAAQMFIGNL